MKIIPVINPRGIYYKVVKKTLFTRRTLHEKGRFMDPNEIESGLVADELLFSSVDEAIKEIRKQFGRSAVVTQWEGE